MPQKLFGFAVLGLLLSTPVLPLAAQTADGLASHNALMPLPSAMHAESGALVLKPDFSIAIQGASSPRLQAGVVRALHRLRDKAGFEIATALGSGANATLVLEVASDGGSVQGLDEDESYTLTVTASSIHIKAATTVGAFHALETMLQLAQPAGDHYELPAVEINDSPRFHWRGLMIDCGRHFEPIAVLKRNIDAMAAVKLNVFHWHLIDDQGFRMESKRFPKLTGMGSDGLFYTQEEARDLVAYARARGIRVVPEFEMPGHSTAWLVAYPELTSGTPPTAIRREFGISDYVMDPTRDETYTFIKQFLEEMTAIFPDQYVHIGGDEAPAPDWKTNPKILAFKKAHNLADNDALQAYFNQRVLKILTGLNRRMVGWDEIFNPALPKDVVVQSWRGEASLAKGAQQGYQGVLSAPYYLDAMKPAGVHFLADPVPADTVLTPAQQKLILGGEVAMWAEQIDQYTIDSRIWPRTAAIAERFWSPQSDRDVDDMYRRLLPVSVELETLGVQHLISDDRGLRGLAGTENIDALRTFSRAFEPAGFSDRYRQQHTSQLTPLTSFVDAVRPDPPVRHALEMAAKTLLADPQGHAASTEQARRELLTYFTEEASSVPEVQHQMANAPRLMAMKIRAEQLATLAEVGKQAVQYLSAGQAAPSGWKTQSLASLETAKQPGAIVRFVFLDSLSALVNGVR